MPPLPVRLAAEIYGLNVLRENIEDSASNTTRFLIMSASPDDAEPDEENVMTSFIFRVRNVPAALYKALGGFATNKVNMTKLESYQPNGFLATQFYADIEGHPESEPVRLALEELSFYCSEMDISGVYKAAPQRAARCKTVERALAQSALLLRKPSLAWRGARQKPASVEKQWPFAAARRAGRHRAWMK